MTGLYHLNVIVHVLAAFLWLDGMFFLAAVGAPVQGARVRILGAARLEAVAHASRQ